MEYITRFSGDGLFFVKRPSGKTLTILRDIHDNYPILGSLRAGAEVLPAWNPDIPLPGATSERESCNWSIIDNGETLDDEFRYELRYQRYVPRYINGIKTLFDEKIPYTRSGDNHRLYIDWLMYLMRNLFYPNEDCIYGTIAWLGTEFEDFGRIVISTYSFPFNVAWQLEKPKNDIAVYSYSTDGSSHTIPKGKTNYNVDNDWKYPPDL